MSFGAPLLETLCRLYKRALNFDKDAFMYHRLQNKFYPLKVSDCQKKLQYSVMKFNSSNKFNLYYYGQVNSLRLKSSAAEMGQ